MKMIYHAGNGINIKDSEFSKPLYKLNNLASELEILIVISAHLTKEDRSEVNLKDIQVNDVLLMQGIYEKLNHVGLYIGDQTILHHVIGKLSCREIYDLQYQQLTKKVFRYEP